MYTKEDLKEYLKAMGLTGKETILVHSSMKSIGEVEGLCERITTLSPIEIASDIS